jgi:inner membrane protein
MPWLDRAHDETPSPADRTGATSPSAGRSTAMLAGSHVVLGLSTWAWVAPHLGLPTLDPMALALAVAGSLLPDLDHPRSWVGQRLRPISRTLAAALGHRGATHSLLAVSGAALLLHAHGVSRTVSDPLVTGYLSHLAADLLTPAGLRLAWPLRGSIAVPLCRTGSLTEMLIVAAALVWTALASPGLHLHTG